jgi:hypothetical protein
VALYFPIFRLRDRLPQPGRRVLRNTPPAGWH